MLSILPLLITQRTYFTTTTSEEETNLCIKKYKTIAKSDKIKISEFHFIINLL